MLGSNKLTLTHMLNKTFKKLGLGLGALAIFTGCATTAPIEEPDVVIENALTKDPGSIAATTNMDFTFKEAESGGSGTVSVTVDEKSNLSDPNNLQSESSMQVSADITIPEGESTGNIKVDAALDLSMIGKDIYGSLTQLDISGDAEGIEEVNAMLPLFVGPYMNETVHLPLAKFEEIAQMADPATAPPVDFTALESYANDGLRQDLADAKAIVVASDNGVEKIKTASGASVPAYQYDINFDAEGFKTFVRQANETLQFVTTEELDAAFAQESGDVSFGGVVDALNQAFDIKVWIGQEDYHLYKMEFNSDLASLKTAAEAFGELTEADQAFFESGEFDMSVVVESEPIDDFTVEVPADEDVIDLGPLLDLALQGAAAGAAMDTTGGAAMTDEEFEAMMDSMDLGDLEGMEGLEDLQL